MHLPQGRSSIKTVQQEEVKDDEPLDAENEYLLFKFEDKKPYTTIVDIDGKSVSMEIDTGAIPFRSCHKSPTRSYGLTEI